MTVYRDKRTLCSDGTCIGVIGPDGRCKECGKPYRGPGSDETVHEKIQQEERIGHSERSTEPWEIANHEKNYITEIKGTCSACGNVWYFGKSDKLAATGADMRNLGKNLLCCSGCFPAILIPDAKKEFDPSKCPKCNSQAIRTEEVTHEVQ